MSYSITVTARGGELTVSGSGEVPDGQYVVGGHVDEHTRSVSVTHSNEHGHQLASAGVTHSREH